ncbi:YkuS family protein [Aneurinibacillus sp. BA2021]|nr:YkuS family protein [Aneurinibacillus sp. BA2021]
MARIGVENSLGNIKQYLESQGHQVMEINEANLKNCDCCIISGQDENMMGMANTVTQAPVINADGMTAEQVLQAVQRTQQQ